MRSLPNYGLYLNKIKLYCKTIKLRLEYSEDEEGGAYVPSRRAIKVNPELPEGETIAVLLHELGHLLDDTLLTKKRYREMDRAYRHIETPRYSHVKATIVFTERRAWEYGRVIAKILGIPLGKWYDDTRRECIRGYQEG